MNTYTVEVKEILVKQVTVEAYSKSHAESLIKSKYYDREIKLTSDNCIDSSVTCISEDFIENQPGLFD